MTERVRVVVRIRPFLPSDPEDADLTTLLVDDTHVCCGGQRVFRVDKVFKMEDDTVDVYEQSVRPVVDEFFKGFNATVMAYGQTGTGKTHTISSLLPQILGQIVNEGFHGNTDDLSFQYIEVYGDSLRDLLSDDPVGSSKALQIYDGNAGPETGGGGVGAARVGSPSSPLPFDSEGKEPSTGSFVSGALRVTASSLNEIFDILSFGTANRATGATNVHQHSSRSHSVFTVFNHKTRGKLHIVDLAGSERNKKTLNVGQRLQESIAINGGLLALGNVIRALSRNHHHQTNVNGGTAFSLGPSVAAGHVPYRSSKLTRLLQDALGGNGKTLFIACVAPDSYNKDETLRSLQYCALAMKVVNAPIKQYNELYRRQIRPYKKEKAAMGDLGGEEAIDDANKDGNSPASLLRSPSGLNADLQLQLDMFKQFCDEQEAEILAMREQLADRGQKLQVCEEELKKDEVIFSRQIVEMERLVRENKELRRSLAERDSSEQKHEEQYRQLLEAARDPNHDSLAERCVDSVDKKKSLMRSSTLAGAADRWGSEAALSAPGSMDVEALKKTLPFLRKTLTTVEGPSAADVLSAIPARETNRDGRAVERMELDLGDYSGERDEQLLALTKEALHYQRANTQLRHELSAMAVAMESQKRDAAMLRLELNDLHQLLR